jgi:hypothetical protein
MMPANELYIQVIEQQRAHEVARATLVCDARRLAADERAAVNRPQPRRKMRVPAVVSRALGWQPA